MFSPIFAGTVRHRQLILAVALALAVALSVARGLSFRLDGTLGAATGLVGLLAFALGLFAWLGPRPAALLVEPAARAFATAPSASQVYMAAGYAFLAALLFGTGDLLTPDPFIALPILYLVIVGLHVAAGWRGLSVQLRPEGVCQRDFAGRLTVPWEALAPGRPSRPRVRASILTLTYARPELVRRRGLVPSRRRLRIDNVHAWFIADAIRHYVDHPQHRAAIGDPAEYQRLWQALAHPPTRLGQGHAF
ncbi:hypothetical protein [Micromonospora chersina]|uniref:hypothetical protein n=1 Tax=Micromonospora chersina TaxID=47854 RepID=UPI0033BDD0A9